MPRDLDALPIALVGAGAVGRVLALALREAGLDVRALLSRSARRAASVAKEAGVPVASADLQVLPSDVRLVLVCTPDTSIRGVAEQLAALGHPWTETAVAHTSGALSVDVLAPLRAQGAHVFGFHPLQTLTRTSRPSALHGAYAGVEEGSTEPGGGIGDALALRLGMRSVPVTAGGKVRYHLAATLASNGLVALMGAVADVLATLGVGRDDVAPLLAPLLRGTMDNLAAGTPEEALTGPVVRGDAATLDAHLEALGGDLIRLRPLYIALQREALRLAVQRGALAAEARAAVEEVLGKSDGKSPI